MIELTLLGLQTVRDSNGRELGSLAAQPKRFALLAYLAVSGSGGFHRRDTLAAMFWPDLDQFAARRALRNTLYHLREVLGDGALITQGDDALAIDPSSGRILAMVNQKLALSAGAQPCSTIKLPPLIVSIARNGEGWN